LQKGRDVPDFETDAVIGEIKSRKTLPQWLKKAVAQARRYAMPFNGKLPVVGVNKYVMDEKEEHQPFRIDYAIERKAIERIRAFRNKRNQQEVDKALDTLKKACVDLKEDEGELMPALVEAARKGVTNGEMMEAMRGAFGWVVTE